MDAVEKGVQKTLGAAKKIHGYTGVLRHLKYLRCAPGVSLVGVAAETVGTALHSFLIKQNAGRSQWVMWRCHSRDAASDLLNKSSAVVNRPTLRSSAATLASYSATTLAAASSAFKSPRSYRVGHSASVWVPSMLDS
jgi:hypothetical protein